MADDSGPETAAPAARQEPAAAQRGGPWRVVLAWSVALGTLGVLFDRLLGYQYNPNQHVVGQMTADGTPEIVLERSHFNQYLASGKVNGLPAVFLIDTGASDVAVPGHLADALGLQRGRQRVYTTANGPAIAYATRIERISIDTLELRDIAASINPSFDGNEILLGMSFLKHLEFTQREGTLILRPLPEPDR